MFGKYFDIIHGNILKKIDENYDSGVDLLIKFTDFLRNSENLTEVYNQYVKVKEYPLADKDLFLENLHTSIATIKSYGLDEKSIKSFITENQLSENIETIKTYQILDRIVSEEFSSVQDLVDMKRNLFEAETTRRNSASKKLDERAAKIKDNYITRKSTKLAEHFNVDVETIKIILTENEEKTKEAFNKLIDECIINLTDEVLNENATTETLEMTKKVKTQLLEMKSKKLPTIEDFDKVLGLMI